MSSNTQEQWFITPMNVNARLIGGPADGALVVVSDSGLIERKVVYIMERPPVNVRPNTGIGPLNFNTKQHAYYRTGPAEFTHSSLL
jgi:hypothetical protein